MGTHFPGNLCKESNTKNGPIFSLSQEMLFRPRNPSMHNVIDWSNIHQKSCGVHTARFLMYV